MCHVHVLPELTYSTMHKDSLISAMCHIDILPELTYSTMHKDFR